MQADTCSTWNIQMGLKQHFTGNLKTSSIFRSDVTFASDKRQSKHREAQSCHIPIYKHQHNIKKQETCSKSIYAGGTEIGRRDGKAGWKKKDSRNIVYHDMYGKQTCKFFRLTQVAWTCSLIVWICRNIYRWEGPAQISVSFSLSKAHSGCKGSKKGETERERSKL